MSESLIVICVINVYRFVTVYNVNCIIILCTYSVIRLPLCVSEPLSESLGVYGPSPSSLDTMKFKTGPLLQILLSVDENSVRITKAWMHPQR